MNCDCYRVEYGKSICFRATRKVECDCDGNMQKCNFYKFNTDMGIVSKPFSWNDNMSEVALEDFSMIQKNLSYIICQNIGMALAKLEILEQQGCKVEE